PYHPRTLSAVRHRAMVHAAMSNPSQAEADYRRVLVLNSSADDDAREDLAIAANNLAVLLRERGNLSEAQAMLARAVWVARGVWGPTNWRTAMVQAQHASVLAAQQDFEDAETKLLDAHAILSTTLGDRHTETRAVARELFNLYTSWDQAEGSTRHAGKASRWQSILVGTSRPAR
ncbi:MAG: tetratricopeptide repeat protein, partial [Phycisphaerales bacterium JB064]